MVLWYEYLDECRPVRFVEGKPGARIAIVFVWLLFFVSRASMQDHPGVKGVSVRVFFSYLLVVVAGLKSCKVDIEFDGEEGGMQQWMGPYAGILLLEVHGLELLFNFRRHDCG